MRGRFERATAVCLEALIFSWFLFLKWKDRSEKRCCRTFNLLIQNYEKSKKKTSESPVVVAIGSRTQLFSFFFFLLLSKSSPRRDACESAPIPGSQSWIPPIATPTSPNHSLSIPKLPSRTTWPSTFFRCIFVSLFVPAWRKIRSSRRSYTNACTPP